MTPETESEIGDIFRRYRQTLFEEWYAMLRAKLAEDARLDDLRFRHAEDQVNGELVATCDDIAQTLETMHVRLAEVEYRLDKLERNAIRNQTDNS
jgi:hypothetical protein